MPSDSVSFDPTVSYVAPSALEVASAGNFVTV